MAASPPLPSLRNGADSVSCRGATCSITALGSISNAWRLPGEVDWSLQASSVRPDFSTTAGLRQLGQPHQKFLDKFLDLFDPVVRGARLNVSSTEIATT